MRSCVYLFALSIGIDQDQVEYVYTRQTNIFGLRLNYIQAYTIPPNKVTSIDTFKSNEKVILVKCKKKSVPKE